MQTKNGIELDLSKSNYKVHYHDLIFYFSSELYMAKFQNQLNEFTSIENIKINNKYKIIIDMKEYLAVALYKRIEKRGFLIKHLFKKDNITEMTSFKTIL